MKSFRDYIEDKENKKIDKELEEDATTVISGILGGAAATTAIAFGGALLVLGGLKVANKLSKIGSKILNKIKDSYHELKVNKTPSLKNLKTDPKVVQAKQEIEIKRREFQEQLGEVYKAIDAKDFDLAKEEFSKVEKSVQNMPDVHKAIIAELTKALKEPPLYIVSPGNKTYQMVKKIINIRVARAAAKSVEMAFEKASEGSVKKEE